MFTYRDLKAIQEGNRRNQDVMDLLREVKRLRELAAQTYSVIAYVSMGGLSQEDRDQFRPLFDALGQEPAVTEYKRMREKQEALEFRRRKAMEQPCADASGNAVKSPTISG